MEANNELPKWLIFIPIIIILVSRTVPFLFFEAPLGYDTGLYRKTIEIYQSSLPYLPSGVDQIGIFLITDLLGLFGFSIDQILFGFHILADLFLGIGIYILVKKFFNLNAAIYSFFLFAVSVTQFQAYWFMFYKNILALFLMLVSFWLLKKKSWLVIPVAGFMGGVHSMTFFLFVLIFIAHFVFNRHKKYCFISGISILFVALSLYIYNFSGILNLFPEVNPSKLFQPEVIYGGRFFDFSAYLHLSVFYFPFAVLGFIYLIKKREFDYLFFWFLINFLIVYLGFFFHNRFIVFLDIIAIILAGAAIDKILNRISLNIYPAENSCRKTGITNDKIIVRAMARTANIIPFNGVYNKIAVLILIFGMIYFLMGNVLSTKPLISKGELNEIKSLDTVTEENAFVMSTISHYSPWIYGYSGRKTIAPGLFQYDTKWSREEWDIFWATDDLEIRHNLLDRYEKPLYIFVGDWQEELRFKFDRDPALVKYSKRVYKYK